MDETTKTALLSLAEKWEIRARHLRMDATKVDILYFSGNASWSGAAKRYEAKADAFMECAKSLREHEILHPSESPLFMHTEATKELKHSLEFSSRQGTNVAVIITQETARRVLLELQDMDQLNKKYFTELEALRRPN